MYGGVQVQAAGGCKVRVQGHFLSHNKHMFIELQEAKIRIDDLCLDLALFLASSLMDHIYYLKWFQEFEFHKKIQLVVSWLKFLNCYIYISVKLERFLCFT